MRCDFFQKNDFSSKQVLNLLSKNIVHESFFNNFEINDISSLKILKKLNFIFR